MISLVVFRTGLHHPQVLMIAQIVNPLSLTVRLQKEDQRMMMLKITYSSLPFFNFRGTAVLYWADEGT